MANVGCLSGPKSWCYTAVYKEKFDDDFLRSMMVIEDWAAESGPEATVNTLLEACKKCGIHRNNIEAAYKEEL